MTNADRGRLWALLAGIALVAIPFLTRVPLPVTILAIFMAGWVSLIIMGRAGQLNKWQRLGMLLLVLLIMTMSYGTLLGKEAGTGFLLLLGFLKVFEIKDKRDVYIVIYLEYFLIATNFFHSQSPWIAVYVFASVIYLTSVILFYSDLQASLNLRARLRIAGRMIVQAIPLMLILFILFPRIPGPLWGLPKDADSAVTGLSEDMSPGSMSSLIQSEEVAFRVRFDGEIPAHENLYWRGPVFTQYDGQTWAPLDAGSKSKANLVEGNQASRELTYTVTLEPHQRKWLFALNYPTDLQGKPYQLTRELQLLNKDKVRNVIQYKLTSDPTLENHGFFEFERERNLQLPTHLNPETQALAQQWVKETDGDHGQIINRALRHFNQQPFVYTLNPPILGNDAMDDFLFETQRGFCEHYSSAFVFLMRSAGIPARVVTGYQGGEKNPVDDYLIVRQSSAHAWTEVWLEGKGWQRVDPTAAVSPDRIESGIQDAVAERDQLPSILIDGHGWFRSARYQWDSFNHTWNEWVVGFDKDRQKQFLSNLGFKNIDWQGMVIGLTVLMSVFGLIIGWWVFRQGAGTKVDRILRSYARFCKKLARSGQERQTTEGPQEYVQRIENRLNPDTARQARNILRRYLSIRYGSKNSPDEQRRFVKMVNAFKVALAK